MTKVLSLIDADGLCYHSSRNTLEESILTLNEKIQNIYEKTQCTHAAFFISKGKYFRHNIDPLYKANRGKYNSPLKYLKTLKSYLEEEYQANWMELAEADDLICYWYNNKERLIKESNLDLDLNSKVILCSPDKDLLLSIQSN